MYWIIKKYILVKYFLNKNISKLIMENVKNRLCINVINTKIKNVILKNLYKKKQVYKSHK